MKRGRRNINKDMTIDEMTFEEHEQIVKPSTQTCDHIWRATVRSEKKCACVRTVRCCLYTHRRLHGSCHCLYAKLPERAKKSEKCERLQMESGFR